MIKHILISVFLIHCIWVKAQDFVTVKALTGTTDSGTYNTKYRTDTSKANAWAYFAVKTTAIATKVNITDTSGMLTNYARNSAVLLKLNISDTANMVAGYLRKTGSAANLTSFPTLNQNTTGTAGGLSANIVESQVTNLVSDLALKAPLASPTFTGTVTLPNSTVTNAMLAGSIDLSTKVTGVLPFASNAGAATAAAATTGTVSVPLTSRIITVTPTGAITFNGTGGVVGQQVTFVITTSGVSSFNITFGTAFKSVGVLATGTTTAKVFTVSFICVAATPLWDEISRTAAQ